MELTEWLQVILISGGIFFILGYKMRAWGIHRPHFLKRMFSTTRYLKFEGYLSRTNSIKEDNSDAP